MTREQIVASIFCAKKRIDLPEEIRDVCNELDYLVDDLYFSGNPKEELIQIAAIIIAWLENVSD